MLASTLDYRPGKIEAQALVWSANLGPDAFVFTTHPGHLVAGDSPSPWSGNGANPRVGQFQNVLVAIYDAPLKTTIGETSRKPYTHAWFPRDVFDEVRQEGHWIFGRKGKGYVGLHSMRPARFVTVGEYAGKELRAYGLRNVWICELGSEAESGSFDGFVKAVSGAAVQAAVDGVSYISPSQGVVDFGWTGPLRVAGADIPLRRDLRYDNPFIQTPRYSEKLEVSCGSSSLLLALDSRVRISVQIGKPRLGGSKPTEE
jgi:hypothetical protein